jgi:FkbM family methyltransferase
MIEFQLESSGKQADSQIADLVRGAIASGALNPGEPLPAIEELAERLQIGSEYVLRAYRDLQDARYIEAQSLGSEASLWFVRKGRAPDRAAGLLMKTLIRLSGHAAAQSLLSRTVDWCHHLMGVGSGGYVPLSGEVAVIKMLANRMRPPYVVIDAGAYRGWFVKVILDNARTDELEIHCFEPCETTFRILERNVADDPRIHLIRSALGRRCGEAPVYFDGAASGRSSLTRLSLQHCAIQMNGMAMVEVQTIDHYCREHGIDRIHLLKIDVEGHELDVLEGARELLSLRAIDMVSFELGRCAVDTRTFFKDFYYLFQRAGMNLYRITPSGCLVPIPDYDERHEQFRTTNFLAVKNG